MGILTAYFEERKYKKNQSRLLGICGELIDKYEKKTFMQSAKQDLMKAVQLMTAPAKEEIKNWRDSEVDYIKVAHTLLANASFDLLSSGRYHLYTGMLNPMSCGKHLLDVYNSSMQYALENKFIDEQTKKEQYELLIKNISSVG